MKFLNQFLLISSIISQCVHSRVLEASSLVTCMSNSQVDPTYFKVTIDPDTGSVRYDISLTTEVSGYIYADVVVYAYGFRIIHENIDFCNIGWKQFCPIYPGSLTVDSIQYIEKHYIDMIPGIAYTFPDLDAQARLIVTDSNGNQVGCIQAGFGNGKTVAHVGVKWATAVIAGIGLLVSAVLSAFGNSSSASRISANAVSLFVYFQSVVIISMLHVQEVPPIVTAWTENLAWSMGLIRVEFMQKIFRWYVQATGGTPTQYLTNSKVSVLVQRSIEYSKSMVKKVIPFYPLLNYFFPSIMGNDVVEPVDTAFVSNPHLEKRTVDLYNLQGDEYLKIIRGIERVGYQANIEPTSIVVTGFTFFTLCLYVLVGLFFISKTTLALCKRNGWLKNTDADMSRNWRVVLKGILQRYIYIGFTQLTILSLWEFTVNDSPAVIVLAAFFLLFGLSIMGWACYRTMKFGSTSVQTHNNAAAILYGDPNVLSRYGFFYTMYNANKYWWGGVTIVYVFIKALFVSLAQKSGKTQALVIFILDLAYTVYLIIEKPYLDKPTNIVNILMCVVNTLNSFFFLFFSNLFGQPAAVGSVMGLIFFVLNAAFSLVLLIMIIVYVCIACFSKNPDARFSPAKDDRTSFQKNGQGTAVPEGAQELFDLGIVAKDHQDNWAGEMYKLKDMVDSSHGEEAGVSEQDKPLKLTQEEEQSFGAKLMHKLTGGKSLLRRNKSSANKSVFGDQSPDSTAAGHSSDPKLSSSADSSVIVTQQKHQLLDSSYRSASHEALASLPKLNQPQFHQRTESNTPIISQQDGGFINHHQQSSFGGNSDYSLYQNEATQPAAVYGNTSGAGDTSTGFGFHGDDTADDGDSTNGPRRYAYL